ncbi:pSer/pThr/pTyr-binding forkhead associated (FHA) protein [Arcanobacterium wilhelmae]|uniref:PSer/pThr/pTyr-binding forkhead associated (FHA) protein n=1 Tax=Arcanobacterium wilhelmae TaxID=1803177 RepID=A0ABT9NBT8_9ACTO|nr:FHA domain-containing protein [Arcanobacterium wilhelmae]MDP9800955.1 pSer/pThr/pTyr-binding forkhead associated (FHA) protein [Arcanobacterium wilhelmae]WFN90315.1 FHA domain-containing protein [Arcanobacterium wilhelmae]
MSAILFTVLRFGFLALLWLFVLLVLQTIRGDVFGTRVADRGQRGSASERKAAALARRAQRRETPTTPAGHTPARPRLVVVAGPLTGTTLPLGTASITVGRSPDSALVLDDGFASSRHARFYNEGGQWWIEDLNSTNGTWLGSERIYAPVPLHPGSRVTIGKTTMELAQ